MLFLPSTLFYHEKIKYISRRVREIKSIVNDSFQVGQYLPDWHLWDVLQDFFVNLLFVLIRA